MTKLLNIFRDSFLLIRQGGRPVISSRGREEASLLDRFIDVSIGLMRYLSFKDFVVTSMLLLLVLMSAVGVVYSSHLSRQLFAEQALLFDKNDQMQLEWAQLLLEQSAWSSPGRIESIAGDKLDMSVPKTKDIQLIY